MVADDVRVTLPPWQKAVGPEAEMVGAAGPEVTVTTVAAEGAEVQFPSLTVTV